ncbi:MAG: AmmeMemoRadiSam system protein B [Geobacteraceae bacterium]|nr:AmmeMemoRadiSam system protein B [Geobacteraceae bacterium]
MKRLPAVAGQFYPGNSTQLRSDLATMMPEPHSLHHRVTGIIAPHAGYIYSGGIAGKVYASIYIPSTVLILGPNHRGIGSPVALYPAGEWLTPLGSIPINSKLNSLLNQHVPFIQEDFLAHEFEHSLEVQVPFIQYLKPDVSISALCLGHGDYPAIRQIGQGIAVAMREYGGEVLIVASSDMTHYESAASVRRKDGVALEKVLKLNPEGLLQVCSSEHITMCGAIPAAIMLVAAKELGAVQAELVAYGTSGDVTGDNQDVVGYAALTIR